MIILKESLSYNIEKGFLKLMKKIIIKDESFEGVNHG